MKSNTANLKVVWDRRATLGPVSDVITQTDLQDLSVLEYAARDLAEKCSILAEEIGSRIAKGATVERGSLVFDRQFMKTRTLMRSVQRG